MVKIRPISMAISELMIIVPKRVGQKVTWHNTPGEFDHCGIMKGAAYCVVRINNADYHNSENAVFSDLLTRTDLYYKSVNLESHRASYELYRAFA